MVLLKSLTNNITLYIVGLTNRLTEFTGKVDIDGEPKQNLRIYELMKYRESKSKFALGGSSLPSLILL